MLSIQIDKILKRNDTTKQEYIGCFAADKIPIIQSQFPHCFCVNTSCSDERGEHWVAIYVESPSKAEYFDSFGIWPPISNEIFSYLSNFSHVKFNKLQMQSEYSAVCGKHVIYFLHMRCKKMSFDWIVDHMFSSKSKPDILVSSFLDHLMNREKVYLK